MSNHSFLLVRDNLFTVMINIVLYMLSLEYSNLNLLNPQHCFKDIQGKKNTSEQLALQMTVIFASFFVFLLLCVFLCAHTEEIDKGLSIFIL